MFSAHRLLAILGVAAATWCLSCARGADDLYGRDEPRVDIVSRSAKTAHAGSSAPLRVDVRLVPIPVTVSDVLGRPISGLTSNDFHVFEDNVEQRIVSVATEDAPISLGMIFDTSASMNHKIEESVAAVEQFLKTNVRGDEYLLVRFSDRPEVITDFIDDASEISGWLHSFHSAGWTALYDAIYMGLNRMKMAKNSHKAVLILSDGGDNRSRYTASETKRLVEETDVRIYSVALMQSSHVLEQICEETGGSMVRVHKMSELPDAMERVSRDLRSHYVLYYYSTNPQKDGHYRKVRLQVDQPRVHVSWRHGYYAPN
jgi:Ca-activated chloride channel family protein